MKYRLINIVLLFLSLTTGIIATISAQDQPDLRSRANRYFRKFQYVEAAKVYLQLANVEKPYLHDMEKLATCYAKMNKYEDAEIWFSRLILNPKANPINLVNYGLILKANSNYIQAKQIFQEYVRKTGDTLRVTNEIAGCDSAQIWIAQPANIQLRNESGINTEKAEFSAFPFADHNSVYFVGEPEVDSKTKKYGWTGNAFLKLFKATVSSDSLSNAYLADLNVNKSVSHVGPVLLNTAGDVLFITRTNTGKNRKKTKIEGKSFYDYNMELYIQSKINGNWSEPVSFKHNDVEKYSVGHAALSNDGKVLYFVSDMPGGYGGTDIWYCELQSDGTWGQCVNAGKQINTIGNELFPFYASSGTLYFSSNQLPGMGGLDVFSSQGEKERWSKPQNLRYPLNSPADDFAYWNDKTSNIGYISSNRKNGKGSDDIYAFNNPTFRALLNVSGVAYDKKTSLALADVGVTVFDEKKNIVAMQQTKPDGTFHFELDKMANYHLQGTKLSYFPDTASLIDRSKGNNTIKLSLYLDPLFVKGKIFRLKNIVYDFNEFNIRSDAALILNELVQIMHENPTLIIELGSHTDCRGVNEYNQKLSQKRAQSVVDYLTSKGIARNRMIAKGYGESVLLNKCADGVNCTEDEHQANRRTEFKVLDY